VTGIHIGDARNVLPTFSDGVFNCCVTSPPYFGLRDYGHPDQMGLEPTPDAYVAGMVGVFREVRRCLRDDGVLWLNIGDSYAANRPYQVPSTKGGNKHGDGQSINGRGSVVPDGLKPKDLIGIPWMLAFALRQPWYAGRIANASDRVWLAAMIDGEGCMFIHKRKAGSDSGATFTKADGTENRYARKNDTYSPAIEVANTHLGIVERCQQITGLGSVTRQDKDRRLPLYRWHLRADDARKIVREIYPFLVSKKQQARILCGCPTNGEGADAAHKALMLLHNGSATSVDFKEPADMHEPGWYLRSDVIWSKPNPMPESVTDRPTKAHEYVFLLTKSERYYFDADAISEPATHAGRILDYTGNQKANTAEHERQRTLPRGRKIEVKETRNARTVWTISSQPYKGAHYAVMPPALARRCVLSGCPIGGFVLDPFFGSGTVGQVCDETGRQWCGIELNPDHESQIKARTAQAGLPFGGVS
jgi:DNA modification methylase